jgi:signal transduction histidine kinase/ActR/RegA family two-component response regulator
MIDYKALFNDAPNPYLILDPSLKIIEVNQAYLNATMTQKDILLGQYLFDAFPANPGDLNANGVSNLQASMEDVLKYRKADTMAVQKYDIPKRDGSSGFEERFWCSVNSPVLGDNNELLYIIHNAQDVTDFMHGQPTQGEENESLKIQTDLLEAQVYRSAQSLQDANKKLKIANEAKSTFLACMSHELRTPMNSIMGFSQLLETDTKEPLSTHQKKYLQKILQSGDHLLHLINDVLDLAKIESGSLVMSIETVNLCSVVSESMELVKHMAESQNIKLLCEEPNERMFIAADRIRLRQIVLNLLSNAIKYNKSEGSVNLWCEKSDATVRLIVADTGQGIPQEQIDHIFEPFDRLGAEDSSIEGTGIGLTITKRLVEMMHGILGVESEVDKGTKFHIDLPLAETPIKEEISFHQHVSKQSSSIKGNYTLLYVEDNIFNRELLEAILERTPNLKLLTAEDAESGIDLAIKHKPDLILMDLNLPNMNGFEALLSLKGFQETKETPIVALSANAMPLDIKKALNAGFAGYLTKPINIDELYQVVNNNLSSID